MFVTIIGPVVSEKHAIINRLHRTLGNERGKVTASASIIFPPVVLGEIPIPIGDPYLVCLSV
jgi:hypothetical protein